IWWPSTSAALLSETASVRSTISPTGALSTAAISTSVDPLTDGCGAPFVLTPWRASAEAKAAAAARDGSATYRPSAPLPSSVHSAVIGGATSCGKYLAGQSGLTFGPANSESSYASRTEVMPCLVRAVAVRSARSSTVAREGYRPLAVALLVARKG